MYFNTRGTLVFLDYILCVWGGYHLLNHIRRYYSASFVNLLEVNQYSRQMNYFFRSKQGVPQLLIYILPEGTLSCRRGEKSGTDLPAGRIVHVIQA